MDVPNILLESIISEKNAAIKKHDICNILEAFDSHAIVIEKTTIKDEQATILNHDPGLSLVMKLATADISERVKKTMPIRRCRVI